MVSNEKEFQFAQDGGAQLAIFSWPHEVAASLLIFTHALEPILLELRQRRCGGKALVHHILGFDRNKRNLLQQKNKQPAKNTFIAIISLTGNQPSTVYCVSQSFKTRFCFYTVRLCLFSFHLTFVVNKHLVKQQPACFGLQIGHRCHLKWVWSVW